LRKSSRPINCADHDVAQYKKRGDGRHHEKRDLPQTAIKTPAKRFGNLDFVSQRARHLWQLRRGDRHAEETDGKRIESLRVGEPGDRAGNLNQAGQPHVRVGADLHDAPAEKYGKEIAHDRLHVVGVIAERQAQSMQQAQHDGQLNQHLQRAACHRSPR